MTGQGTSDPRANQKARTRAAIVEAAQRLRDEEGETPTVAHAATAAGVSRATAYRYFPTQEALAVEVEELTPDVAEAEAALAAFESDDAEERLLKMLDTLNAIALEEEEHFRRALWVYQDTWLRAHRDGQEPPVVREGRRMRWLDRALGPLVDLPEAHRRRLWAALALTLGGDSIVVMKDVCGLDDDETQEVLRWAAVALLRAGLDEVAS